jgi:hypothetical protein
MSKTVASGLHDAVDYDPPEGERQYYRKGQQGQRAYLVKKGGRLMLRLDRGAHVVMLEPFTEGGAWIPDKGAGIWQRSQIGRVAFEADRALRILQGHPGSQERTWDGLKMAERAKWATAPDLGNPIRNELYKAIIGVLGKHCSG